MSAEYMLADLKKQIRQLEKDLRDDVKFYRPKDGSDPSDKEIAVYRAYCTTLHNMEDLHLTGNQLDERFPA